MCMKKKLGSNKFEKIINTGGWRGVGIWSDGDGVSKKIKKLISGGTSVRTLTV